MNEDEKKQLRSLAAWFTGLGSRVIWDSNQQVRSIAVFGEDVQDKHLSDLRRFPELAELNLTRSRITDAGLFYVGKLVQLESLLLGGTVVTDEGFEQLQNLRNLTSLNLIRTGLTDQGLQYFRYAVGLEALWLECTDITDSGLEQLPAFSQLVLLDISNTAVTDDGLVAVGQLKNLEELSVSACEGVVGTGLCHLAGLNRLSELWIDNCSLRDEHIHHIVQLPLTTLSLNWTDITDQGLQQLDAVTTLRELSLIGSRVSLEAAAAFRRRHPDCTVQHTASRSVPPDTTTSP